MLQHLGISQVPLPNKKCKRTVQHLIELRFPKLKLN